jgi:DNA-binding response OmpR family regulator
MGPMRILVADNDPEVGKSICEFLRDEYAVYMIDDGNQIPCCIEEHKIDILLTDINISNVYFYSLISTIKEKFPQLVIIIMYVYCDYTQEMEKTIRKLADAIFFKPFNLNELKRRIQLLSNDFKKPY